MNSSQRLSTIAVLILAGGCARPADPLTSKSVEGVVRDQATNQPIEGAIVTLLWEAQPINRHITFDANNRPICYHAESAVSDAKGVYHIPAWQAPGRIDLPNGDFQTTAYKRGHQWEISSTGSNIIMSKFSGSVDERLDVLSRGRPVCDRAWESSKNLYPGLLAAYLEAKEIAVTKQQLDLADGLKRQVAHSMIDARPDEKWSDIEGRVNRFIQENLP